MNSLFTLKIRHWVQVSPLFRAKVTVESLSLTSTTGYFDLSFSKKLKPGNYSLLCTCPPSGHQASQRIPLSIQDATQEQVPTDQEGGWQVAHIGLSSPTVWVALKRMTEKEQSGVRPPCL